MRLVIVSDTHGEHESLGALAGDILIHCGDVGDAFGEPPRSHVAEIDAWFARLAFRAILVVGGNHDLALEQGARFEHATYLQDETFELDGLRLHGTPWLPHLEGWPFCVPAAPRRAAFAAIPETTDVLITHTPPFGILDRPKGAEQGIGCPLLLVEIPRVRPLLHCFGHVHAGRGLLPRDGTLHVNATSVGGRGGLYPPVVLDLVRGPQGWALPW